MKDFEHKDYFNARLCFRGDEDKVVAMLDSYAQNQIRFLYKGIIINHNKKPSQPTLKRRFFQEKGGVFFMARFWKGVVLT